MFLVGNNKEIKWKKWNFENDLVIKWKIVCWIKIKNFYYWHFESRHIEIIDRLIMWWNLVDSEKITRAGFLSVGIGLSQVVGRCRTP